MEIRDIRYFVAVCDCKSFTLASEALHVTQPAISVAVKRLEEYFETPLLERGKKKKTVSLTAAGRALYQHSQEILTHLEVVKRDMLLFGNRSVTVGIPQILGAYLFPKILSHVIREKPQIRLDINELDNGEIIDQIAKGVLELGIITKLPGKPPHPHLVTEVIGRDKLCLCTALDHPLAKKKTVSLTQMGKEKFILFGKTSSHYMLSQNLFKEAGISPEIFMTSDKIQTIKYMIVSGLGVSLLMNIALQTSKDELAIIPLEEDGTLEICVCYNANKPLSKNAKELRDFIVDFEPA